MTETFIKVELTKKEKMNLLLFDLLPERILKEKIVYKYNRESISELDDDLGSINLNDEEPDKIQIPAFFDNIDDGESNF